MVKKCSNENRPPIGWPVYIDNQYFIYYIILLYNAHTLSKCAAICVYQHIVYAGSKS